MENYFILRISYDKPFYYLTILFILTQCQPICKINWIKTNKIQTFSYVKNNYNKFSSFETKSMVKYFLYSNIYSPSTQFFNLYISWNINGWNAEKRDGIRYFNEIFKLISICLKEVGNSQYLNTLSNNYPFLCHYNKILRKTDPYIPGMRGLSISIHCSRSFSSDLFEYKYIISVSITSFWGVKCNIGNIYVPTITYKEERMNAFSEIINWIKKHTNTPSIFVGDFNMSKSQLEGLLNKSSQQCFAKDLTGLDFT